MEELFTRLLQEYGYIILFIWSTLEGELGLIMAGIMCYTGHMIIPIAIFVAGLGGFVGDQIYFYIGRYNKKFIAKTLKTQRRKFALAHLLLQRYGWPIIFVQRYLYGMRTVIPMSIGVTRYSAKMFAFINFVSALVWAAITIILAYFFGEELLAIVHYGKEHYYVAIPFAILLGGGIYYYLHKVTQKVEKKVLGGKK
ncbi:MAG: DedA family protein [Helicobacter sp.]|nr:DedA family protein [Helicobacteraceae bacterium]MDY3113580.1 DedA family protein [Helicobacter sp.]